MNEMFLLFTIFLASIYLCPPFVEEDMNTELLDDTLDKIFEESDSEDYNESEMEELETEVSEDTERWADDGDLKKFLLRATRGRVFFWYFVTQENSTDERKNVSTSNYSEERPVHIVFNHLICTK
ncbi:hypothetical protein AVEN_252149-1 [Araneus ventricosus]|uniref:PiggyBac transposable element-derived protein domain-containing protein n=1 Tax=Araneus ventricosus TaxID=182803 RepID=A0A4Y2L1J1_ARAVE|nr:hypothetical protein AVEN_252149-1 [Araneus ventricosus]